MFRNLIPNVRERYASVKERYEDNLVVAVIAGTSKKFSSDDVSQMAAGLAYYGVLSMFPLILGLIAILGLFIESESNQAEIIKFATDYLPGSEEIVGENIQSVIRFRGSLGLIAVVGLLWSGSAIFGAANRSVNKAWNVQKMPPIYIAKARQLVMAIGVGVLFVASVATGSFVQFTAELTRADFDVPGIGFLLGIFGRVLLQSTSVILTFGMFLIIYRFMPNTRTYWRYVWPGALVSAFLFELAKILFIVYVDRFTSFGSVYGSLAPIIVLLIWVYLSSIILLLGAEISSEYGRLKGSMDF